MASLSLRTFGELSIQIEAVFGVGKLIGTVRRTPGNGSIDIAESRETGARGSVDGGRVVRSVILRLRNLLEPNGHRPGQTGLPTIEIGLFIRIRDEVVQLRPRRKNQFELALPERRQGTPAEAVESITRLGIHLAFEFVSRAVHQRHECFAVDFWSPVLPEEVQNGRRYVDDADRICHAATLPSPRCANDQRDAHDRLVHKQAVGCFAVFAAALTVIANDHDDRVIEQAALVEKRDHTGQLEIGEADGAEVSVLSARRRELRRGLYRRMRVVEM